MFHIQLLWDLEEFLFYRVLWATVMVKSEAYPVPCYCIFKKQREKCLFVLPAKIPHTV